MRIVFLFILFVGLQVPLFAQELMCGITVDHRKIQGTNINVFQALQKDITEFMNNRKWTDHVFANNERIECNIMIIINEYNGTDRFSGTIQVQSSRPVYGTSYKTTMFNLKERENDFKFEYIENQPIDFNPNTFTGNLSAVLAFYAYLIIGMDYDSFSLEGGSEYFMKAQNIVNQAQNYDFPGWKSFESKDQNNRYYLIENFTNKSYSQFRKAIYTYHRLGLDIMNEKPEQGRAQISEAIRFMQKVYRANPRVFILQTFFDAKSDEIVKVYSDSPTQEANMAAVMLKEMDIPNAAKYEKMGRDNSNVINKN